jgi:membrane protease YdiL (CAAX protease family)
VPLRRVLGYLGVFVLWNLALGAAVLLLPPLVGAALGVALALLLLHGYLLRPEAGSRARRWATLRLRPLGGETRRWMAVAVPVFLLFAWAMGEVYTRLVPIPPESLSPFEAIVRTPEGRLSISVLAVGIAPIVEEFVFRGLIQRTLERRLGAAWGIVGAAALFALVHLLPWVFPLHFFLGLVFGFAVYATRSIWAGVVLHATNNAAAMVGLGVQTERPEIAPTLWETGLTVDWWTALATLGVAGLASLWVGRRLWEAGRPTGLRAAREHR